MIITKHLNIVQLENIKNHQYSSTGYTYLDHILDKFYWEPVSNFLPESISPNLLTLLGLISSLLGVLIIIFFDTTLTTDLPPWVYCFQICCLFGYLTFDSLDGKQARKYKNFSKIGELLDHGGDALSDNFMAIIVTQALKLNNKYEKVLILISFQLVDFCMLWEQNVTSLYHPFRDQIGLSENVLFSIFILLSRIFFSENFNYYLGRFTLIFYTYMLVSTLLLVYEIHSCHGKKHICKLFPLMLIIQIEIFQVHSSFYEKYTLPCMSIGVLLYGLISSKFITMNMSKSEFNYMDLDVFYYFICVFFSFYFEDLIYVGLVYVVYFIFLKLKYIDYVFSVTFQIIQHFQNFGQLKIQHIHQ